MHSEPVSRTRTVFSSERQSPKTHVVRYTIQSRLAVVERLFNQTRTVTTYMMQLHTLNNIVRRPVVLMSVIGLCSSCEQLALLAPTASIVTVVASRTVLPLNGSTQITATVIEQGGTPVHNGTLVTFATTLGSLDPTEAFTRNGQAVTVLRAGTQSGIAMLSAFSGSARSDTPVKIALGAAAVASLSVTASPATISAKGGAVTLSAKPSDASGNALAGVAVSFATNAGSLAASTVVSNSLGEARTTVTTDRETTIIASVGEHTATATVRVNLVPAVTIAATGSPSIVGEPMSFTVTVTAGSSQVREVIVNFGDGSARSLGALVGSVSLRHTYRTQGTFRVVATATDTSGEKVSVATVLVVENAAPLNVTVIATPITPQVGAPVAFTASATQPVGTLVIDRYEWSFGDNRRVVTTGNATSHVYDRAGRRVVAVRVVEQDGRTGTARVEIDVIPRPPLNINLTANPRRATVGDIVVFTATVAGSTVPITHYEWNFGDGTRVTTTGNIVNHVYRNSGTRETKVRALDQTGRTTIGRTTVDIAPRAPLNVNLTANPLRATVGDIVIFTATVAGSTVPIARYEWDFGDRTSVTTTGNIVNHVYTTAGALTAQVTVFSIENDRGASQTTVVIAPTQTQ